MGTFDLRCGRAGMPMLTPAPDRVDRLLERELERFITDRPESRRLAERADLHWIGGVPMHWMLDWGTPFPLTVVAARDAELIDADGHRYADFCLGDTGAMFGHSPGPVATALQTQALQGLTCMLPSGDVPVVGELLASRFGLPAWQMAQTASEANRAVLRWAREITGRPNVLVFDGCYHGAVDDTLVESSDAGTRTRPGVVGQVVDVARHVRVIEFNDPDALAAALAPRDVACVLAEPVMTNAGMVLPLPGYLEQMRAQTASSGTLLVIDETHTISSGPGGHARLIGLEPDLLVIGKAIAGGFPCAVYGCTSDAAAAIERVYATKPAGNSGIGTTLAGNPFALAALRANLEQVMTVAAYHRMNELADRLCDGLECVIATQDLEWHVSRVGARVELGFSGQPPRTARESLAASHPTLERALHLYLLNRGVLVTPFHNMMLASPVTREADIDALVDAVDACVAELRDP